jgi:2-polyprenyl-3-methyl-5-hydroxy-6-metoxy-1,4-benzoquinol methylase
MKDSSFSAYSLKHVHFYGKDIPLLLEQALAFTNGMSRKPRIVDMGCGDGGLIFALHEKGLLKNSDQIVGVDISESRIKRLTKELPFVKGLVSDASDVKELQDSSFDFVICSQLIEHVVNDSALLQEVRRLLRKRGIAYVSSVIKKPYGAYFYFKDGSFRLDPTHSREYSSADELLGLLKDEGFEIISSENGQIMFPLTDLIARLLIRTGFLDPNVRFYQKHRVLDGMRKLRIPVVGYASIEVLARKTE